ncbi:hypothetical protein BJ878DRAFT_269861 [Calycina marina]|uniref:Ubiquitin-activating enzyme E1-like n=1 Tax=Calycina marina TaxID=1763456 RepID=A0A9P7Z7R1_9HELO|nr:hypothetical protein BJ878DRAFT_269861 [Calycina marina]
MRPVIVKMATNHDTLRDTYNKTSMGIDLNGMVKDSKVLLVGAGGIGCELLKNLVMSGFGEEHPEGQGEVHIIDMDTIDLSNLNRQFLFRSEHIKRPKATVAHEVANQFNPRAKLYSYVSNIKEPEFNVTWFKQFTMVFNALDNLEARRHVNKMCIAADIPLIESGTTGFQGQVQVIKTRQTACYDCTEKEVPKAHPVCTIRSTPSQPIHCIVWAKSYLLNEIFGVGEEETPDLDSSENSENAEEIRKLKAEAEALKNLKKAMHNPEFPKLLFNKVFKQDIERLLSMEEMWKARERPKPLDYDSITPQGVQEAEAQDVLHNDQTAWSLPQNLTVYKDSLKRLVQRVFLMKVENTGALDSIITFDKDDIDTLDFVTATSNIRSEIFKIEKQSRFEVKKMAGNIIPAIATTNAIVAGLCVLEAFKVLKGNYAGTKEIFLSPFTQQRLLSGDRCQRPNPKCEVCGPAYARILADLSKTTLRDVVEILLREQFGYGDKFTIIGNNEMLFDEEEDIHLDKTLLSLEIKDGAFLTVTDDEENPRVNLNLIIQAGKISDMPVTCLDIACKPLQAAVDVMIPRKPKPEPLPEPQAIDNLSNGVAAMNRNGTAPKRRASEMMEPGSPLAKRPKMDAEANAKASEPIVIDDDGGILVLDD